MRIKNVVLIKRKNRSVQYFSGLQSMDVCIRRHVNVVHAMELCIASILMP